MGEREGGRVRDGDEGESSGGGRKRIPRAASHRFNREGEEERHRRRSRRGMTKDWDLAFTHHRPDPPPELVEEISPVIPFCVDLNTGEGLDAISIKFGQPHIVVNCAAISVPRVCEEKPADAMAINVPSGLINWLSSFAAGDSTLLVHLSTDQVYEGTKSFYKEEDEAIPVNMYGKSKLTAEEFISGNYTNYAILRSSIIYGPQTISPIAKSLPVQWIDDALSGKKEVEFFFDEYRCPIFVKDVVNIILDVTKTYIEDKRQMQLVLNIGGPSRLSSLAETVASVRGHDASLIKSVSARSVNRGVTSPPDISMDISKLNRILGISPVSYEDGVKLTLLETRQNSLFAWKIIA